MNTWGPEVRPSIGGVWISQSPTFISSDLPAPKPNLLFLPFLFLPQISLLPISQFFCPILPSPTPFTPNLPAPKCPIEGLTGKWPRRNSRKKFVQNFKCPKGRRRFMSLKKRSTPGSKIDQVVKNGQKSHIFRHMSQQITTILTKKSHQSTSNCKPCHTRTMSCKHHPTYFHLFSLLPSLTKLNSYTSLTNIHRQTLKSAW